MATRQPNIRKLAIGLTYLQWLILTMIALMILPQLPWFRSVPFIHEIQMGLTVLCSIAAVVSVILIQIAQRTNILVIILCALLAVAPCVNILVLLLVSSTAQATLKAAGLRIRIMGVPRDEVERLLNPNLCGSCGYNLTGNVTGVCPECSHHIPRFCQYCGNSVLGTETGACPTCNQPIPTQSAVAS